MDIIKAINLNKDVFYSLHSIKLALGLVKDENFHSLYIFSFLTLFSCAIERLMKDFLVIVKAHQGSELRSKKDLKKFSHNLSDLANFMLDTFFQTNKKGLNEDVYKEAFDIYTKFKTDDKYIKFIELLTEFASGERYNHTDRLVQDSNDDAYDDKWDSFYLSLLDEIDFNDVSTIDLKVKNRFLKIIRDFIFLFHKTAMWYDRDNKTNEIINLQVHFNLIRSFLLEDFKDFYLK